VAGVQWFVRIRYHEIKGRIWRYLVVGDRFLYQGFGLVGLSDPGVDR